MNNYKRMYKLLIESVDIEAFKDFWSQHEHAGERKPKKPTRASEKTKAARNRANKKEANTENERQTKGTYRQQRGK